MCYKWIFFFLLSQQSYEVVTNFPPFQRMPKIVQKTFVSFVCPIQSLCFATFSPLEKIISLLFNNSSPLRILRRKSLAWVLDACCIYYPKSSCSLCYTQTSNSSLLCGFGVLFGSLFQVKKQTWETSQWLGLCDPNAGSSSLILGGESESESHSVMSDPCDPMDIQSMEFSRPEYLSGQPFPPPGDLRNPGIKSRSPTLWVDSLPGQPQGSPRKLEWVAYPFFSGSSQPRN